jgi:hypothetical protein
MLPPPGFSLGRGIWVSLGRGIGYGVEVFPTRLLLRIHEPLRDHVDLIVSDSEFSLPHLIYGQNGERFRVWKSSSQPQPRFKKQEEWNVEKIERDTIYFWADLKKAFCF